MKTTNIVLLTFTHQDLEDRLKEYQKDILEDVLRDYLKNKTDKELYKAVVEFGFICSKGFHSDEFQNLIESVGAPFLTATSMYSLIEILYQNPSIFIPIPLLDEINLKPEQPHECVMIVVDGTYIDMKRIAKNF